MKIYRVDLYLGKADVIDGVFSAEIIENSKEEAISKVKLFWKKETETMYNIPRVLNVITQEFEIKQGLIWTFLEGI